MTRMKRIAGMLLIFIFSTTALMAQEGQKVTDAELTKFAQTFQQMRMTNQEAQLKMQEVIKSEDLEIKRFNEIHKATLDPDTEVDATAEEQEKYEDVISEIEKMQVSFQQKMEDMITSNGLTIERYQQIATRLQQDAALQERLKEEFQKK
ncbi:DUF4168 domain-containing protein [Salinimicrobium soli]|uniref:DUF4168 domain-containing protein n=1 Tax=Salinimicrobium soli TaxID=1254399 RepID=UPI003AB04836